MLKPKGFTLLEFILYFALLAIVMTAITAFTLSIVSSQGKGRVIGEVESSERLAMLRILRSTRTADSLTSISGGDAGVLTLNMGTANPTIFDLVNGTVRITENGGPAVPLTTPNVKVSKLRFTSDAQSNGNVTITTEIAAAYVGSATNTTFSYSTSTSGTAMVRKQGN